MTHIGNDEVDTVIFPTNQLVESPWPHLSVSCELEVNLFIIRIALNRMVPLKLTLLILK
jgi:hypothetical protein